MQDDNNNTPLEQPWRPPMNVEPPAKPAHPPELRFQEESRRNSTHLYKPLPREENKLRQNENELLLATDLRE